MTDNPFDMGEGPGAQKAFVDRWQEALDRGFGFQRQSSLDIDGLPTTTNVNGTKKVIDQVFHPDPNNRLFNAYGDTQITDEAIDFFRRNPSVTSVDFNVSYPGYPKYDYHPMRTSDLADGFAGDGGQNFSKRSAVFADSLKERIGRVNEVFDANPQWNGQTIDTHGSYLDSKGDLASGPKVRRIDFTPEDSRNLSQSLNDDLIEMFRQAPEGTTFVNNPDSPSRGRLYSRGANFSAPDAANNQFVVKGPRGSLQPLQITDAGSPALGPSNFDPNPGPIRAIREVINPDSVEEIRRLPAFQRQLYQKPDVKIPKGKNIVKGGLLADVGVGAGLSYLTGETDNPAIAAYSGLTSLIPESTNTGMGTMPMVIDGQEYHQTQEPSRVIGPGGKYYGLEILNGKPQIVPYGSGAAGGGPIYQPVIDTAQAVASTAKRRVSEGKWRPAGIVLPELGLTEMLGLN